MADEKKPISADSPADDAEISCRDVVMGAPADEGRATDHSDHRRKTVQLAIAGVSLVLVLGSAGYFALNPDAMSMGGDATPVQTGSNSDGGTSDAELDGGAFVAPEATPVENSSKDSGDRSSSTSGDNGSKGQSSASDSAGSNSTASSSSGPSGSSDSSSNSSSGNPGGPANGSTPSKPNSGGGSSQQGGGGQADKPAGGGQKPAPKTVTVSISVDSSAVGGPVSGSGTFTFEEGATVYDALCALGLSIGSQDSIHGVYVSSINGLAEKEHGASSGWMYAVNGKLPNMACSAYKLVDGDSIQWRYVTG
ncbi:MAG: DUF4430 domain-containing protein [Collinsella intestinalis]|uniref:Transcobalamin-like C-terminal domain-containing protein n=1 Tax=Collinsella intestinalis TaxID=147207 RepID=A0A6N3AQQ1_9ACTN